MAEETENVTPAGNLVPENVGEEMHDGLDASLPSESEEAATHSPTEAKTYRLFGREKPVHQLLGGGKGTLNFYSLLFQLLTAALGCI